VDLMVVLLHIGASLFSTDNQGLLVVSQEGRR